MIRVSAQLLGGRHRPASVCSYWESKSTSHTPAPCSAWRRRRPIYEHDLVWQGEMHYLNAVPINAIAESWIDQYDQERVRALSDLKSALETTMSTTEFVYPTYINTTPEELWQALTDGAFIRRYFGGGGPDSRWQVGSPVRWSMQNEQPQDLDQVVLESEPGKRLSYTWHNYQPEMKEWFGWSDERFEELVKEPRATVTFDIEPAGAAVKLTVTHEGFAPDSEMLKGVSSGWPAILSNLKTLLETGETLPLDMQK